VATHRTHIMTDRLADEVWSAVSDADTVSAWFPVVQTFEAGGRKRRCTPGGGVPLDEEIITNDLELYR